MPMSTEWSPANALYDRTIGAAQHRLHAPASTQAPITSQALHSFTAKAIEAGTPVLESFAFPGGTPGALEMSEASPAEPAAPSQQYTRRSRHRYHPSLTSPFMAVPPGARQPSTVDSSPDTAMQWSTHNSPHVSAPPHTSNVGRPCTPGAPWQPTSYFDNAQAFTHAASP